jgi:hypothetical protein
MQKLKDHSTELRDELLSKRPATPLPWNCHTEKEMRRELAAQQQIPVFSYAAKYDCEIAQFGIKTILPIDEQIKNAVYIAHAANSYPRLVEALRHLEQAYANKHSPQHRDAARNEALSILRSLGESE